MTATEPTADLVTTAPRTRKGVTPPVPRLVADLAGTVIGIDCPANTPVSLDAIPAAAHTTTVSEFMKLALSGHYTASLGFFEGCSFPLMLPGGSPGTWQTAATYTMADLMAAANRKPA